MHAVQPAPVPEALAAKLQRLQADALETVHWVMLHLAKSLTSPQEAEPADPITTQRARLCLQAARDLLRFRPPAAPAEPTDDDRPRDSPPTRPWRKPGLAVPPAAQTAQARARPSSDTRAPQPASKLLAAAGTEVRRFGERINSPLTPAHSAPALTSALPVVNAPLPPDSGLRTPDSSPRDSSPVAHTSPRPPRPQYFTDTEAKEIIAVMQTKAGRLTPHQYARILEWNAYAIPAGLSRSFGITAEQLEARKPLEPAPLAAPPPS